MIKKHKRTHTGWMRRTSRIYLENTLNKTKSEQLKLFLNTYQNALNYTICRLWKCGYSNDLLGKAVTDSVRDRFGVTARLAQCACKQAKETVNSQSKKSRRKQRIPRIKSHIANLDSRFVTIESFNGHFEMCLKFSSGVPKIVVPFNMTKHTNNLKSKGWDLGKSVRLGYNEHGLFVDLIYEKERPLKRTTGKIIGIDRGFRSMLYTSDDKEIGTGLADKVKRGGTRRKSYQHYITTEENKCLKDLNLDGVKAIVLENLKYVKHRNRGKFSRHANRLLSFWHYAKVGKWLEQLCEELGVSIYLKSPWKTSQRCPICGNIDRRNRKGKKFLCLRCGHADDADHVGAKNLEFLGLAEVYSLRSLQTD